MQNICIFVLKSLFMIKVIGFDADDTLWVNGVYFREAENKFCSLLSPYMSDSDVRKALFNTECENMEWYGYGVMAFTLSLIETSIKISKYKIPASVIEEILEIGRSMLAHDVELMKGVRDILPVLYGKYKLVVITKGDLLDQERKLKKSGLLPYFNHVEVVSEKYRWNYENMVSFFDVKPEEFMMVGNSVKSDIIPVCEIGSYAIYVPLLKDNWKLEDAELPGNDKVYILKSVSDLPDVLEKLSL